jgi:hypothetical protein
MKSVSLYGSIASAFAFLVFTSTARAETRLALDLDYATAIDEHSIDSGTDKALRLGQELDLVVVSLTPEIGGSYHTFAGALDASHYSGFIGGRLGFGKILEPGVFAHVGIGRLSNDVAGDTGPAFDMGVYLDFTLLPILDLGVHGAYDLLVLDDGESFDWARFGAHASIGF